MGNPRQSLPRYGVGVGTVGRNLALPIHNECPHVHRNRALEWPYVDSLRVNAAIHDRVHLLGRNTWPAGFCLPGADSAM